jgi:two-component system sensor histidine kinase KdpD
MADERTDAPQRPSPDALLKAAEREASPRGRLRIFVGAAPGVGKTYTMLETARARRRDGADVVVGVVETHGRKDTEALLAGLEVIPRKRIEYRGQGLEEMDLEAIIARRPQIVLVDELAHTNVAGSRHPKRHLDVEEILANGIDVYTTVNIQHIESLNDVIAQITHVRVRETVPDAIFDRADSVELVDLTPDDLIQRLKDGKVYIPSQAKRALEHFFSPANLTALRELALRRTAERVDDQLLTEMQARAISGPWAAGERILVCVGEDPRAATLVRYAKRMADRLHGPFTALHVESVRSAQLGEAERDRIADTMRLALALGGEAVTIPGAGRRVADDVIAYARANNVTQLVIGKSARTRWFEILHGSVVHDLVRVAGNISVHVVAGEAGVEKRNGRASATVAPIRRFEPRAFGLAALIVAAATGLGILFRPWIGVENIDLIYLTAIVGIAVGLGLWPSLFASLAASLLYNLLFLPPLYTFTIADPTNVAAFFFFIAMAVIVSNLAARVRMQAVVAMNRARTTEALYSFSRKLAGIGTLDDLLWATAYQTASMLKVRVLLLLPENGTLAIKAAYPPDDTLDEMEVAAAKWAWENDRPAGRGADTLPGARRLFLPMRTGRGAIGVVGMDSDRVGPLLTPDEMRLLGALIDQSALAIERVRLVEEMGQVARDTATEKLRSALLTSISHDLKTPLASILGAAGALRDLSDKLGEREKAELVATITEEAERLNRFIANLLDMTKLESGAIVPNTATHDLREIVGSTLRRAEAILRDHRVVLDLSNDLPMPEVDPVLFEQALFNILDNAGKYAPAGTTLTLRGRRDGDAVMLQVLDEGSGIAPDDLEQIFGKFYRARKGDQVRAGTGLGLAIARGFIEAMHGTLTAANRSDRPGAVFTIRLPVPKAVAVGAAA